MLENIFLINLFLVSNSLITISFLLFSWLYIDLYLSSKKRYALYIGFGGFLLCLSFFSTILFELLDFLVLKEYVFIFLQFFGLLLVAYGYGLEIIPGEPNLKKRKGIKLKIVFWPLFAVFVALANFFLSAFIATKVLHKVNFGKSKEFLPLVFFWIIITLLLLLNIVSLFSNSRFAFIEISLMKFSVSWVFVQILLLVCFVLMYRWIKLFLSFRNFTKILFDVWIFSILLCIVVTFVFTILNVGSYEKQIVNVLRNNGNMVKFNIDQVKEANLDVLQIIVEDESVVQDIISADLNSLDERFKFLVANNFNLDSLYVVDLDGRIIYNSERRETVGEIWTGSYLIEHALLKKEVNSGYWVKDEGTIIQKLGYKIVVPVFHNGSMIGAVSGSKYIDQDFLKFLNSYTGQEFLLVRTDGDIMASVLGDSLDIHNIIRITGFRSLDTESSIFIEINNTPFIGSLINFGDEADLAVVTPYKLVASTIENSMYVMAFYSIFISVFAVFPSYHLAKRVSRDSA